jgi:spore germination cell wall hydrolase CwlJ-like protein
MSRALLLPRWGLPQFLLMALVSITMVAMTPNFLKATGTALASPMMTFDPNAVTPFVLPAIDVADHDQAVACLAQAVFFEAGFEPVEGQRAVAQVVVNRVRDPNFPASVCGVVYQGYQRKSGCQFSFVCDGSMFRRPPTAEQWEEAKAIAMDALNGYVDGTVGAATHYHADYCAPWWRKSMVEVTQIGQHIFYTWPGHAGTPQALTQAYQGGELAIQQMAMAQLTAMNSRSARRA